jgi:hypothetical protein
MPPTQYRPSRRNWIKLWTHEWLTGTVRWQLTLAQRAMWADLLALAGDSRFPGIVTPGESAGKLIGYPVSYFAGLFRCTGSSVTEAFVLFEQQNRIKIGEGGEIHIVNWEKYQSEYQEKRQRKQYKQNSAQYSTNVRQNSAAMETEGEVEGEGEGEGDSPLPPANAGDETFFVWQRQTIGVFAGRKKRLFTEREKENLAGARPEEVVNLLTGKGFQARVVPKP